MNIKKAFVDCDYCGKSIERIAKWINHNKKHNLKSYCNKSCQSKGTSINLVVVCNACGKKIKRQPSDIKQSKTQIFYCSKLCYYTSLSGNTSMLKDDGRHWCYKTGRSSYRKDALGYYGEKCSVCGYSVVNVLQVHHKDKNRDNNQIENLDVLCPTHHREYELGIRCYA